MLAARTVAAKQSPAHLHALRRFLRLRKPQARARCLTFPWFLTGVTLSRARQSQLLTAVVQVATGGGADSTMALVQGPPQRPGQLQSILQLKHDLHFNSGMKHIVALAYDVCSGG